MNNTPENNQNRYPQQNGQRRSQPYSDGQQRPRQQYPQQDYRGAGYTPGAQQRGTPGRPDPRNMTPQQKEEYMRRLEAQRRAQGQQNGDRPRYRKRKRSKPNVGLILFIVLICIVVGVSLYQISQNAAETEDPGQSSEDSIRDSIGDIADSSETDGTAETGEAPADPSAGEGETGGEGENLVGPDVPVPDTAPLVLYDTYTVNSADINKGDLILVNYQYAYALADTVETVNVYENKTTNLFVSTTAHRLTAKALQALSNMADGFTAATGLREMLIVSSYRNTADQQAVYDSKVASNGEEYAKNYVANPGYSEHHTGAACDLSFYRLSDGASIPVSDHDFGYWLTDHCAEYGFILRYPDNKVDITKISYEPWHFRYVGKPHAAVIMKAGMCLEEYIDSVRNYTLDRVLLHTAEDGTTSEVPADALPRNGYVVYFIPAAEGETTEIRIPKGYEDYIVSGNNADGFIVTVYLGSASAE